jgi:hypothetical protein
MVETPAVYEPTVPDIFNERTPGTVVKRYQEVAKAVAGVIDSTDLAVNISGRKYVRVEGWQTLGALVGVFASVAWTKRIQDDGRWGYEAEAIIHRLSGEHVSTASAECWSDEENWQGKADFQVRSMAQTRACAKAFRLALGFVMGLAGYEATPAEEMDGVKPKVKGTARKATDKQMNLIDKLYKEVGPEAGDEVLRALVPKLLTIDDETKEVTAWERSSCTTNEASSIIEQLMAKRTAAQQPEDELPFA